MKKFALAFAIVVVVLGLFVYLSSNDSPNDTSNDQSDANSSSNVSTPELETEVIASGLNQPWDIIFLPDGTILFSERAGAISVIEEGGNREVIHQLDNVYAVGEGGLLGMTVDPLFDENRFTYACYSTNEDVRVSRWRVGGDVASLHDQEDIITGIPVNTSSYPGRHSGCRLEFGPDGNLWVGTGDAAQHTTPQNPRSLGGKILRVTRSGDPVEGNLSDPFDSRIYSYGHRNTQGLAFDFERSTDERVVGYSVEHGPDEDDEINRLVTGNFGWEPGPGYDESAPMTDTGAYPDAIEAIWSSGSQTLAPSGAALIAGEQWGMYEGQLAVAMLKTQHVRLFSVGSDNLQETTFFRNEYGRIRTVRQGPDGSLYLLTANGDRQDRIIRARPVN